MGKLVMKRIISVIIAIIVAMSGLSVVCGADSSFDSRSDFCFGINSHPNQYNSYPEKYLEEQIYLIAKSGSKMIRIGVSISEDMSYFDNVVGLCNKYGLKIIMVFKPDITMGLDYIEDSFEALATRYNGENGRGFVDIIQAWNETDITLLRAKYGTGGSYGKTINDYFTIWVDGAADLPEYTEYFAAAKKGLRKAGGKTKLLINFSYTHYGCLLWYIKENVKPDYIGWDWYVTKTDRTEQQEFFKETCASLYNDIIKDNKIPVIICETNVDTDTIKAKQDASTAVTLDDYVGLLDIMDYAYTVDWIKGLVFYELLDQPSLNSTREGYYGLINCELNGIIGNPKPIYNEIQRLLKGNNSLKKILKSDLDLSPYDALTVKTADDTITETVSDSASSVDISLDEDTVENELDNTDSSISVDDTESQVVVSSKTKPTVKQTSLTVTTHKTPWILIIIVSAAIVLAALGVIVIYTLKSKRKYKL